MTIFKNSNRIVGKSDCVTFLSDAVAFYTAIYYYERNSQNDIVGLVDSNMNEVVTYTYDSWGKLLSIGGTLASTVGVENPYRYRGYRYDTETGLYYLRSRYYDPETGRFINADGLVQTGEGLIGENMFAYCNNSPVNNYDPSGCLCVNCDGCGGGPVNYSQVSASKTFSSMVPPEAQASDAGIHNYTAEQSAIRNGTSAAANNDGRTSLPTTGTANSKDTLYNPDGTPKQDRWYGPDGEPLNDRDYNHGGIGHDFPHDHPWANGKRQDSTPPNPAFKIQYGEIGKGIAIGAATVGAGYLIYREIRMVPSLFPPLWWTIPANALVP